MQLRFLIPCFLGLSGCDYAFGLTGEPSPCSLEAFDSAETTDMMEADAFSFLQDGSYGVVITAGLGFEVRPNMDPVPIEAGPLADALPEVSLGIAPENDLLVFSGMSEPPTLVVARFVDGVWTEDTRLPPKGVFAGSPTSTDFGARRVLVRLRDSRPEVQEYEDDGTAWRPVGKPQPVDGMFAPSLTPSGLTMVWIQRDADGNNNVVAANRDSTSDWFGDPVVILHAFSARAPQLLDGKRCDQLYVVVDNQLRRYQR